MDQVETLTNMWSEKHAEQMNSLSEIPTAIKDQLAMELKKRAITNSQRNSSQTAQIQLREQLRSWYWRLVAKPSH
jgi:hypothetical protein